MISLERTKTRLNQLIAKGQEVLETRPAMGYSADFVDHAAFQEWSLGCRTFLESVFGESMQLGDFEKIATIHQRQRVEKGLAILRAVKEDLEFGALGRLEELVSTAIYSDFLGMAETLLAQQQTELVDIAAFLAGAVLENGLRRIATNRTIKQKESDDISALNQKLADGGVYNNLWRKKIDTWNAIRGNADHGRFGRNAPADVQNMIAGVRDFLADFLAT
jgi:hypothetical protein